MKQSRWYIAMMLCMTLVCHSCDKRFTTDFTDEIVVEGWIDAGGFPVVILTREFPVRFKDERISLDKLSDFVVKWAKVTVDDGENSVVLTGGKDNRYFPGYVYTTSKMRGEAGKSYTLTVESDDKVLTSVTTIPLYAPVVDSMVCKRMIDGKDLCSVTYYVSNIPDRHEYYKLSFMEGKDAAQYLSSFAGVIDDALSDTLIPMPILRDIKDNDKENRDRYFHEDSVVSVKVATIDSVSYGFWLRYDNMSSLRSMFQTSSEVQDLPTNINGGIGYWCGYNPYVYTFAVKPGVYPGNRQDQ
jgi:hypothetical protein